MRWGCKGLNPKVLSAFLIVGLIFMGFWLTGLGTGYIHGYPKHSPPPITTTTTTTCDGPFGPAYYCLKTGDTWNYTRVHGYTSVQSIVSGVQLNPDGSQTLWFQGPLSYAGNYVTISPPISIIIGDVALAKIPISYRVYVIQSVTNGKMTFDCSSQFNTPICGGNGAIPDMEGNVSISITNLSKA